MLLYGNYLNCNKNSQENQRQIRTNIQKTEDTQKVYYHKLIVAYKFTVVDLLEQINSQADAVPNCFSQRAKMYAVDGGRKKQALPVAAPVWGLLWN